MLKVVAPKGRARSSSLVTVTEVGGDEPENVVDRVGMGTNENAAWVNAPGMSVQPLMQGRGLVRGTAWGGRSAVLEGMGDVVV